MSVWILLDQDHEQLCLLFLKGGFPENYETTSLSQMKRFHSADQLFTLSTDFHIGATNSDAASLNLLTIKRQVLLNSAWKEVDPCKIRYKRKV